MTVIANVNKHATPEKRKFAKQLRSDMPRCQRIMWFHVQNYRCGAKFRREKVLFGWIADFYCPMLAIALEIDGPTHNKADDDYRDMILSRKGILTIRYTNEQVYNNLGWIISDLKRRVINRIREKKPKGVISDSGPWYRLLAVMKQADVSPETRDSTA